MRLSLSVTCKPTGRTKADIVSEVERRASMAPFIIGQEHPQHCKCKYCWHTFQDRWVRGEVQQ